MSFNKTKALESASRLVAQKKLGGAIREYLAILDQDPSDFSLLNMVGDLCVRDGNTAEALRQFNRLATAYTREGFMLKAIAIYKKIAKLDTDSVDPLLKLAKLYAAQGLSHEARDQYAQALAFCQRHSLTDKAVEILRKVVAQDPENAKYRIRLGEFHEAAGRKREACQEYIAAAELAVARRNVEAGREVLSRASKLEPQNNNIVLLEARLAAETGNLEDVRRLFAAAPELAARRDTRLVLLNAYLKDGKIEEGKELAAELYREDPSDFEPLQLFSDACIEAGHPVSALDILESFAGSAIDQRKAAPLIGILLRILPSQIENSTNFERIQAIGERAASTPEQTKLFGAMGEALGRAGRWADAEAVYRRLAAREADSAHWRNLLEDALAKQGKAQEGSAQSGIERRTETETMPVAASSASNAAMRDQGDSFAAAERLVGAPTLEMDFDAEWREFAAERSPSNPPSAGHPRPDLGEGKAEVQFYLDYGFWAEARASIEKLEAAYPGHPEVQELHKLVEESQGEASSAESTTVPAGREDGFAIPDLRSLTSVSQAEQGFDLVETLKSDLERALGQDASASVSENLTSSHAESFGDAFRGLLAELELEQGQDVSEDTPQAHYNLGVAFREMGLIDEAVGEFQKVVRGRGKDSYPPHYVEACALLGGCFMDKQMPDIAARWYLRALEAPDLEEDTVLALNYDLGIAYEQGGDSEAALEKFAEVYSTNIDYRDVAEKIHSLRRKRN